MSPAKPGQAWHDCAVNQYYQAMSTGSAKTTMVRSENANAACDGKVWLFSENAQEPLLAMTNRHKLQSRPA